MEASVGRGVAAAAAKVAPGASAAATSRTGATASRSRRRRAVSIARAQRNARAVAYELYLEIGPALGYGTGLDGDCVRHSRYSVTCLGYVETYADEDIELVAPMTCWFGVRTTGRRRGFSVSYVEGSVDCELGI